MELAEAVLKAKQGDSHAFGVIYDSFADKIFRYIKIKIQDPAQAEDILQEVFVKAWRGLPNLKTDGLNFSAWIYRIASNAINDHFRKVYRTPKMVDIEEVNIAMPYSIEDRYQTDEEIEKMKKCFDLLPSQYKEVLELRYVRDFTTAEIAAITGKTNLAVRLIQHRALKKLKEIMDNSYDMGYEKI
ncbi:sigma-70 family RNA polymerase sigma factor [Patescibacteria group bacterium]|nr:sigma-70 family RNA polymerase sigma factor [Patescibacteria group bacterium]